MNIEDMIETIKFFTRENGRLGHDTESSISPVFVFTDPEQFPSTQKPEWFDKVSTFTEDAPVFVVTSDTQSAQFYDNLLRMANKTGYLYVVNAGHEAQKSVVFNSLLHAHLNLFLLTFIEWDTHYIPDYLDSVIVTKDADIVCTSCVNGCMNKKGDQIDYCLPTDVTVWRYNCILQSLRSTTALPFYESAFNLRFLLWLADRGLNFIVFQDEMAPSKSRDRITADTLHLLHTQRPHLFAKSGGVDVKYIHNLAYESSLLIGGNRD